MNVKDFRAGTYKQQDQYRSFSPIPINHDWVWDDPQINVLLEEATKWLGELNGFSRIVPDVDLFIEMHVFKEANASSRIEGTQTAIEEDLLDEDLVEPDKRADHREVRNYVRAMNNALERITTLPLSNRLLRETHAVLMEGVRGEHKTPGEFRRSQNWIGGSSLSDAVYIPPNPTEVSDLMSDLEKFWHNKDAAVPHLIKAAISHYQFETIHPFLDANGRIGRLMIPLYLVCFKQLAKPTLYLSDFFEKNRPSYYNALSRVRESGDLAHWIKFFLNGVVQTSEKGIATFQKILSLKNEMDTMIAGFGRRAGTVRVFINALFKKPIVSAKEVANIIGTSPKTAYALVRDLERESVLHELTGDRRNRIFVFRKYLDLFAIPSSERSPNANGK